MDPWCSLQSDDSSAVKQTSGLGFEDKFVERSENNREVLFEKLPDSEEYLQNLEAKLKKLSTARQNNTTSLNKTSLVDDLAKAREDAIVNFVTSGDIINNSEDLDLETSIEVHPLARRLIPEQAITVGEQVVLTKADQLDKEDSESGQ